MHRASSPFSVSETPEHGAHAIQQSVDLCDRLRFEVPPRHREREPGADFPRTTERGMKAHATVAPQRPGSLPDVEPHAVRCATDLIVELTIHACDLRKERTQSNDGFENDQSERGAWLIASPVTDNKTKPFHRSRDGMCTRHRDCCLGDRSRLFQLQPKSHTPSHPPDGPRDIPSETRHRRRRSEHTPPRGQRTYIQQCRRCHSEDTCTQPPRWDRKARLEPESRKSTN